MEFSPPCMRILGSLRFPKNSPQIAKRRLKHIETGTKDRPQMQATIYTQSHTKADINQPYSKRLEDLPGFLGLEQFRNRIAITDQGGDYLYEDLYLRSWDLAKGLIGLLGNDWTNKKICVLCDTGLSHVITTWACWMTGNIVVPLPGNVTKDKLAFLIRDSGAPIVITTRSQADLVNPITREMDLKLIALDESWWKGPETRTNDDAPLPSHFVETSQLKDMNALLLYTAGRTGQPRGIYLTHSALASQISRVSDSWDLCAEDTLLHCLPFNQMYGMNSIYAPLSLGARVLSQQSFEAGKVWSHLLGVNKSNPVTVFPATPSIYNQLLSKAADIFKEKKTKDYVKATCSKKIRLMTSSATSLPEHINSQWSTLTGHKILNNYVTTEGGTVFSNRIGGSLKIPGPGCSACGAPVDGIKTRLVRFRDHTKTTFDIVLEDGPNGVAVLNEDLVGEGDGSILGELLISGDKLATRFWKDGKENDLLNYKGWIPTGDIVLYKAGCYNVKGKLNIKTIERGGELFTAADIEKKLLSNPDIDEVTVLGLGDTDAEQKVAAILVVNRNRKIGMEKILQWCNLNMNQNMIPSVWKIVEDVPRDNSGHINKFFIFKQFPDVPVLCFHDSKL